MYTTVKHLLITTFLNQPLAFVLTYASIIAITTVALVCYISTIVLTCR